MNTILVVDDNKTNLQVVRSIICEKYTMLPALSGEIALRYAEKKKIDMVLLDLLMPGMDGRATLQALRRIPACTDIPIIFLTADDSRETEVECLRLGACDFITKPFVPEILMTRIERTLELEAFRKDLQGRLRAKTVELENVVLQTITTIANTLDAKDEYTKGHSDRVAKYAVALAKQRQWSDEECTALHKIALLHDVGKIGVPDAILKKSEPLSEAEFIQIKEHTQIGAHILKDITTLRYLSIGARSHHERFDGKGYPEKLRGHEIPEIARIICIADAYDAMTSDRCYRSRLEDGSARARLLEGAGTQFDPELVQIFVAMIDSGMVGKD